MGKRTKTKAFFSWLLAIAIFMSALSGIALPSPVSAAEGDPANVALGKTVTAAKCRTVAAEGVGIDKATDGDLTTQFKTGELAGPGTDTSPLNLDFTVDLDGEYTVSSIKIIHGSSVAKDFVIKYSNDTKAVDDPAKEWTDINETKVTGHTASDTQEFSFAPVNAKYIRMWVTKTKDKWGFEMKEFEIYGVEVPVTKYTVTYDVNGGSGTPPTEASKVAGTVFTVAAAGSITPPEGKMFRGWNTQADGQGTGYDPKAQITMPESNLILYAIWMDDSWIVPADLEKVGTLNMKGDPGFDSDSVANSDANQPRWLSYPGARFTFNANPNHEKPLQPDLQVDIGGYAGRLVSSSQRIQMNDIVSVHMASRSGAYEDAASVQSTWYPYRQTFTASGYNSLAGVSLSGYDFFVDANSTIMRVIKVNGAADKKMKLTGAIPGGMTGKWDAQNKALVISSNTLNYYYALKFVSLTGTGLTATDTGAVPSISGSGWSLEIPIGTVDGNYYGISFGFAVNGIYTGEGESAATSRAVNAFSQGAAAALADTKSVFDGYLKKVPLPGQFGIPEDIPSFNVTPEQHRCGYYTAWTFLLDQIMNMLPENYQLFPYSQVLCGKPSMYSAGGENNGGSCAWESYFGQMMLSNIVDPKNMWDAYEGIMSPVQENGLLPGEALPSIKAQTAWYIYQKGGCSKSQLKNMYEKAIKKYLLWLKDNPTWNFIANAKNQKDIEFLASVIYDVDFAIKIANEIGMSASEEAMWKAQQADAVSLLKQWFLSDPEKMHQFYFTDAPNKYYGNGREGDSPIAVMNAMICDGLDEQDYVRLINYYRSGVDPLIGVGGFSGYKYPQAAMAVYGMIKKGYTAEARQYMNLAIRDTVRIADFCETIIEAPELEGVKPSLFTAAGLIDFTWMINGCQAYTGTPTEVNLNDGQTPEKTPYENLALNKPVVASSNESSSNNVAENATDGSLGTRWSSAYSDTESIYVDLGEVRNINRVRLQWEAAYGKDYTIDVSRDAVNWTTVRTVTDGYANYIRGENDRCDDLSFQLTAARYVRMNGTKRAISAGFSLWEFEVYNDPNIALGATVVASSGVSSAGTVTDGHLKTQWNSDKSDAQWITVDLGKTRYISGARLAWGEAYGKAYQIQVSNNATAWTEVYATTTETGGVDNISFEPVTARYVRMNGTQAGTALGENFGYSVKEFAVYSASNEEVLELPQTVAYSPITVKTVKNVIPRLPEQITVRYTEGGADKKVPVEVIWDEMAVEDFITLGTKTVKGRIVLNNQEIEATVDVIDMPEIISVAGVYDVEQYKTVKLQVKSGTEELDSIVWSIKNPGYDAAGGISTNGILQTAKAGAVTVAAQLPELGITVEREFTVLPQNVVSFAYGGTATASSFVDAGQAPAMAIDENSSTMLRFTGRNSQWFKVELQKAVSPTGIMIRWYDGNQPKTYDIYFSQNGSDWEKVKSVTSPDTMRNDYTDIQAFEEVKQTKFIKIVATGESKNAEAGIYEFKVFADPVISKPVTSIALTSSEAELGNKQMTAVVTPADATDSRVAWSVTDENGPATALADISSTGALTILGQGTVKVTATSMSNPDIKESQTIAIDGQALTNVALNKKASAKKSSELPNEGVGVAMAIDGNRKTTFKTGEIKTGDTPPYDLTVDLQGEYQVSDVELYLGATNNADFVVQYSSDNSTWTNITGTSITNNNKNRHTFTFAPVNARYIRIWITKTYSSWGFEVDEFEVYGVSNSDLIPPASLAFETVVGTAPALPAQAECIRKGDGSTVMANVTWKAIDPAKYNLAGSFRADGTLTDGTLIYAIINVRPVLSFDLNGGEGTAPDQIIIAAIGQVIGTLPVPIPQEREFLGWNTKADGEGTAYTADTVYTSYGNTTLYAVWKWNTPPQPTVTQTSDTASVTLTVSPLTAGQYALVPEGATLQDSDWRTSNKFTGLPPVTNYDVYTRHRRTLGTDANETSPRLIVTTDKLIQTAPQVTYTKEGDWETEGVTITIISSVSGAAISLDNFSTTDSVGNPVSFTAGTSSAIIYVRLSETETQYASDIVKLEIDFSKQDQAAPSINVGTSSDESSVTLTVTAAGGQTAAYEYRIDGEADYTDLPSDGTIIGLEPDKLINLFVRAKGNAEYNPSPEATAAIRLPKYKNSITVTLSEADFEVMDTVITMLTAPSTVSGSAIEYSFDGGEYIPLNSSVLPKFTRLAPGSTHTIAVRAAEDEIREAGPATLLTITTTHLQSEDADIASVVSPTGARISGTDILANVSNGIASLTVNAVVNEKASWKLYSDAACTSEIPNAAMSLVVGRNIAYLMVTAENGATKVYTITITRASRSSNPTPTPTPTPTPNPTPTPTPTPTPVPDDRQPGVPTAAKKDVPGKVKDGTLSAIITKQMAKDAIKAAQKQAKKSGKEADGIALDFNITGKGSHTSLTAAIDAAAIDLLKAAGVEYIKIGSSEIDITFDKKSIAEIDRQTTGTVTVTAARLTKLSKAAKKLIGSRPVFNITVDYKKKGKTKYVSSFKKGTVTLGIAYKAKAKEKTGGLIGVYVDKKGKPQILANSSYVDGRLIFSGNSLLTCGVGYKEPALPQ